MLDCQLVRPNIQSIVALFVLGLLMGCPMGGCAPIQPAGTNGSVRPDPAPKIIGFVNDVPITFSQVQSDLSERAGRQALLDLILDEQLESILIDRRLQISESDIQSEQRVFIETLNTQSPDTNAYELLKALRASNGLGHDRYPRFLRRNAILRKLVQDTSTPSQDEYELAYQIAFGPTYQVRIYLSDNQQAAIKHFQTIRGLEPAQQRVAIAQACMADSIHPSAQRGGLIADFNPLDPAYPDVLTTAITTTPIGELTPVLSTQGGYVFALVESQAPAIDPTQAQRAYIAHQFKLRKEQTLMNRFAETLIAQAQVTITDPSLNWAWTNKR